jgi:hypothetical protein
MICAAMRSHVMTGDNGEQSNFYEMIAAIHSKNFIELNPAHRRFSK